MASEQRGKSEDAEGATTEGSSNEEAVTVSLKAPRCQIWTELYKKDKYCDVLLVVDGEERGAHKVALACASTFFDKMFTCGLKESQTQESPLRVPLEEITIRTLDNFLELLYTGRVKATYNDVPPLACAAHLYQVHDILAAVEEALSKQVTLKNFLELWNLGYLLDLHTLYSRVEEFAYEKVEEICNCNEIRIVRPSLLVKMMHSAATRYPDKRFRGICAGLKSWTDADAMRLFHIDDILDISFKDFAWEKHRDHLTNIGRSLLQLCAISSKARDLSREVYNHLEIQLLLTNGAFQNNSHFVHSC